MTATKISYFAKDGESTNGDRVTITALLDPDLPVKAGEIQVWRTSYATTQLIGEHGESHVVAAKIMRDARGNTNLAMVACGTMYLCTNWMSPIDAMVWFGLPDDEVVWRRDPLEERQMRSHEVQRDSGIVVNKLPIPGLKNNN